MGTHPPSILILSSDLNLVSSVSGYDSLDMASAHGAAITEAAIKEEASICWHEIFNCTKIINGEVIWSWINVLQLLFKLFYPISKH